MRDPLSASGPKTFGVSRSATSSPGSGGGASPCGSPDGRMATRSGPGVVHVSPSVPRVKGAASTTSGISGRFSSASSRSAVLTRCLANRLWRRLTTAGSTKLWMTWKESDTRSGRWYFLLRPSARHIDETDCTTWPTPIVRSADRNSRLLEAAWSMASGLPLNEFHAQLVEGVQLNPEFVLWLMGFPAIWASCGARAMLSCRLLRRSSSGPSSRPNK